MTASSSPDRSPATERRAAGPRELARLRQDVLLALGVKVLALALIGLLFFGPRQQSRIDPAALFSASPSATNR